MPTYGSFDLSWLADGGSSLPQAPPGMETTSMDMDATVAELPEAGREGAPSSSSGDVDGGCRHPSPEVTLVAHTPAAGCAVFTADQQMAAYMQHAMAHAYAATGGAANS
jgi:hypothetical protein